MSHPTYHGPDFRTYAPETLSGPNGKPVRMMLCEALEDGRWEPFYTLLPPPVSSP